MGTHLKITSFLISLLLTVEAGAATFNLFSPATGVLKGSSSTYVTSAATSTDIRGLWSGTCNTTTFLRADGICAAAGAGTVTSIALTVPSGFSVSGSPITSSGTLGITGVLNPVAGGTGAATLSGVLKGNGTSALTSAASTDVVGLWSGTCNSGTFLRGDGSCAAAGTGSVTSVALTAPSVFSVSGTPITTSGTLAVTFATGQTQNQVLASPNGSSGAVGLRALVAADIPTISLTAGVSGTLPVTNGGTGAATLTGPLKGNGTSAFTAAVASDIVGLFSTCSGTKYLGADGACHAAGSGSPGGSDTQVQYNSSGSFAGSADFAWDNAGTTLTVNGDIVVSGDGGTTGVDLANGGIGFAKTDNSDGGIDIRQNAAGTIAVMGLKQSNDASHVFRQGITSTTFSGAVFTNGPTGEAAIFGTNNSVPISIGVNGTERERFYTDGGVTVGAPTGGSKGAGTLNATGLYVNGSAVPAETSGSFTMTLSTGCTTTPTWTVNWIKTGSMVTLSTAAAANPFSCTSNSGSRSSDTSIPAAERPTNSKAGWIIGAGDNGAGGLACVEVTSTGAIVLEKANIGSAAGVCTGGNWTASGTTTLSPFSVTYTTN